MIINSSVNFLTKFNDLLDKNVKFQSKGEKMKHKTVVIFAILMLITSSALWGQRDDWTPEARLGHSMVTLPDGRVLMYAGEDGQGDLFNDMAGWEEIGWEPITPPGFLPPARADHCARCHVYLRWSGRNRIA